jgi:hypothetical protein
MKLSSDPRFARITPRYGCRGVKGGILRTIENACKILLFAATERANTHDIRIFYPRILRMW